MNIRHDYIPLKRPHFNLRGNQLFFLISKRPYVELDSMDLDLWNHIDGVATVEELNGKFSNASVSVQRLWELAVIEVAPSIFRDDRKRVLIIEPHMDDAVLSVGGIMWEQREQCEFTVVSLVGISNFTSYHKLRRDFFDVEKVTALRRQESELAMRVLGGRHLTLGVHDAPLRYQTGNWSLEWYLKNRRGIAAFINHSASGSEVRSSADSIQRLLTGLDAHEIWIPLGVGTSADHEMTRNGSLWALMQLPNLLGSTRVFFYQDVPYAMQFPLHTDQILSALTNKGASVEREFWDITGSMPEKLRLISIFASQFKMDYMGPRVMATARLASRSDGFLGELLVRVEKLPDQIGQFTLYSGRDHIVELLGRLRLWFQRNRSAHRITILCPMGVGRWMDHMQYLLQCFPNATFEFHTTHDATDEMSQFTSSRIEIRPVNGMVWAWTLRLLKVLLFRSRPLIVCSGNRYRHMLRFIRTACVLCDPLPVVTLDHLVQSLRLAGQQAESDPSFADPI